MGVVYKAKDTKLGRMVALKFLAPQLTLDPDLRRRFVQEAKAASALDHPNIGYIHEINETDDGQLFIAMAYYEGDTLKDRIAQGPLSVDQAIDFAAQIAKGLAKAHEAEIVHRDIKPANILITEDNTVKIVDFGLAKMTGETQLTKTGSTIGTIAYMSPEQLKGEEVDHRTDIWSLGVVLYEMVVGERPYQGAYEHQIIYQILHDEAKLESVPGAITGIVECAMQKTVSDRYQKAEELLDDLVSPAEKHLNRTARKRARQKKNRSLWKPAVISGILATVIASLFFFINSERTPAPSQNESARGTLQQLTYSGTINRPAISPDGELLAYVEKQTDSTSTVWIREVDRGEPVALLTDVIFGNGYSAALSWAPNNKDVAVSVFKKEANGDLLRRLYVFSSLGALQQSYLLDDVKQARWMHLAWDPEGDRIAYLNEASITFLDIETSPGSDSPVHLPESKGQMHIEDAGPFSESDFPLNLPEGSEIQDFNWSSSGDRLVLNVLTKAGMEIITSRLDGTDAHVLYEITPDFEDNDPIGISTPTWNVDGSSIYFLQGYSNGLSELWKIDVSPKTGEKIGEPRRVYTGLGNAIRMSLSSSGRLVFRDNTLVINLWKYSLNDDQALEPLSAIQLTNNTSYKREVRLSEDDTRIAFLMRKNTGVDVYTMPIQGGPVSQQTFTGDALMRGPTALAWNSDSKSVLYLGWRHETETAGGRHAYLQSVELETGRIQSFEETRSTAWAGNMDWAQGEQIIFARDREPKRYYTFNPTSGSLDSLFTDAPFTWVDQPRYSRDGNKIAILAQSNDGSCAGFSIWIYDIAEQSYTCVSPPTNEKHKRLHPVRWSDDGAWIYASTGRFTSVDFTTSLFKIKTDGSTQELIATIPDTWEVDITRDGSTIVGYQRNVFQDVYMIENFDPEGE